MSDLFDLDGAADDGDDGSRPGDGSPLPRLRGWDVLTKTSASIPVVERDGSTHEYAMFVDQFDDDEAVALYRDGLQVAVGTRPAVFPVDDGRIEIATSMYGMKRAHHVGHDGVERQLRFVRGSAEDWRLRFGHRFPRLSRWVGRLAVLVLLVGLVVLAPQLFEWITHLDLVQDRIDWEFTSPISLPGWLDTTLLIGGILASIERALTLRSHWLIDTETAWFNE